MEKLKKKAISHGILGILIYLYDLESTDSALKRLISTKILSSVEIQDFVDQLSILKPSSKKNQNSESMEKAVKSNLKTPQKSSPHHSPLKADPTPHLTVTGSTYQSLSPRKDSEYLVRGQVPASIKRCFDFNKIIESLESHISNLETKQKARIEEESKRKKAQEGKKTHEGDGHNKRFKAKRFVSNFIF